MAQSRQCLVYLAYFNRMKPAQVGLHGYGNASAVYFRIFKLRTLCDLEGLPTNTIHSVRPIEVSVADVSLCLLRHPCDIRERLEELFDWLAGCSPERLHRARASGRLSLLSASRYNTTM